MLINFAAPDHGFKSNQVNFRLSGQAVPRPPVARNWRGLEGAGQILPFHQLSPYEPVDTQFSAWGLEFEGAIALYPSNPSFATAFSDLVLMPVVSTITIKLLKPLHSASLQLRGHHEIRLKALDARGNPVPPTKTFHRRYTEASKAPQETISLKLRRVRTLTLQSSSPFVLEAFSL
ncbi:hypothetical protein C7271_18160 [filamentous cyanobacterium CCP5]|nr:hypothetical protein C7271_18160 [filamentous cyanobacterium CCP5]